MDLDPKNVLSPAGQCQFNELVSVVMVCAENHLATSYPCRGRGLLSTGCKMPTGNITPGVSDSVPTLPFLSQTCTFKSFDTLFVEFEGFCGGTGERFGSNQLSGTTAVRLWIASETC